jgi:hypothetical protein
MADDPFVTMGVLNVLKSAGMIPPWTTLVASQPVVTTPQGTADVAALPCGTLSVQSSLMLPLRHMLCLYGLPDVSAKGTSSIPHVGARS